MVGILAGISNTRCNAPPPAPQLAPLPFFATPTYVTPQFPSVPGWEAPSAEARSRSGSTNGSSMIAYPPLQAQQPQQPNSDGSTALPCSAPPIHPNVGDKRVRATGGSEQWQGMPHSALGSR